MNDRDHLIYGLARFAGIRNADLARQFGLSRNRIGQIVDRGKRIERSHAFWLDHGGPTAWLSPAFRRPSGLHAFTDGGTSGRCPQ